MSDENATGLPTIDLIDVLGDNGVENILTTTDIYEPCWLIAGTMTEVDGEGRSWKFTYRSVVARTDNPRGERLREFVANARPMGDPQIIHDEMMMFGQAELTIWEAR